MAGSILPWTLRIFLVILFVASASIVVSAQITLSTMYPDGSPTGKSTTCADLLTCVKNLNTSMVCDKEGIYNASYSISGYTATFPAYPVCYSYEGYCKGAGSTPYSCFPGRTVKWSDSQGFCCGARPALHCGKLLSSDVCANPGGSPDAWNIFSPAATKGEAIPVACATGSLLSDGTSFLRCADPSKLISTFTPLVVTQIGKPGRTHPTHGFICAESNPSSATSPLAVNECTGGETGYGNRATQLDVGDDATLGEIFAAILGRNDVITTSATNNIKTSSGIITAAIITRWSGSEDVTRTLLSARENDARHLDIIKRKNTLACSNTVGATVQEATIDISTWKPNEPHYIQMRYGPSGINCTIDFGQSSKTSAYTPVAPIELSIGSAKTGQQLFGAEINLSINELSTSTTYYCANDAKLVIDLDTKNQETCTRAGLVWTGSKCCSEREDQPFESYNDPDPENYDPIHSGACYKSSPVANGVFLHNHSVVLHLGKFLGCDLASHNQTLLVQKDTHTNTTLFTDRPACSTLFNVTKNLQDPVVCGLDGYWNLTNKRVEHQLATTPADVIVALQASSLQNRTTQGCCPALNCWDGKTCIANQRSDSRSPSIAGYRCLDGTWTQQNRKSTFDHADNGFCPSETQCLVKSNGNSTLNDQPSRFNLTDPTKGPACLANTQSATQRNVLGEFSGTYCDQGNWTSRTKILALYLIDHAEAVSPGNWAMFCDDYQRAFTLSADIAVKENLTSGLTGCKIDGVTVPCMNQFCVMRYNKGVAWATSLNLPINDSTKSFLGAVGLDRRACDSHILPVPDHTFHLCAGSIWYNHGINSVISLPAGQIPSSAAVSMILPNRGSFITSRLNPIINFAQGSIDSELANITKETNLLQILYFNHISPRDNFAFTETTAKRGLESKYLGARYLNTTLTDQAGTSGCDLVRKTVNTDLASACTNTSNSLTFIGFQTIGQGNLGSIWTDFSAKLRE